MWRKDIGRRKLGEPSVGTSTAQTFGASPLETLQEE
jgi:hypothetical protein